MNARVAILLEFLYKVQSGDIPPNHGLLRQVGSLVRQLPLVMGRGTTTGCTNSTDTIMEGGTKMQHGVLAGEFENEFEDALLMSFLATIAKTTKAVLVYSDKVQAAHNIGGGGREIRK
jgi:hypothetical protein